MSAKPPRKRVQAMAQGRGAGERLVVPLALATAAQISARPLDEFFTDPTQLANGLLELQRAIGSEGIVVALGEGFERASGNQLDLAALDQPGSRLHTALEATRRLRATLGDSAALLAGLSGPARLSQDFGVDMSSAGSAFGTIVKAFCEAGADLILCLDEAPATDVELWQDALKTFGNIARFHRALPLCWGSGGPFPSPQLVALDAPSPVAAGIVTTAEPVAADASIEALRHWVASVSV